MATKRIMEKFIDEYVDVLVDITVGLKNETEEGMFQKSKPLVISGYFTDFDDEYIYIGTEENTVSDMINRTYVVHVGVSKPVDKYETMLDDVDMPSDEEFN